MHPVKTERTLAVGKEEWGILTGIDRINRMDDGRNILHILCIL